MLDKIAVKYIAEKESAFAGTWLYDSLLSEDPPHEMNEIHHSTIYY